MQFLENHKGIVTAIFIFFLVIVGYNYLAPVSTTVAPDLVTSGPGAQIVSLNKSLASIKFDQTIFSSPAYLSLTDFSTPLPTKPVGRSNPFDAL